MLVSDRPTVAVSKVSKTYFLPRNPSNPLDQLFKQRQQRVEAVKSASLVAFQGESVGILGKNGSGKTSLLRMMAGSEPVTEGAIYASSRPTFLGVSPALQGTLSGYRNIFLGLLAMGKTPGEARELIPAVSEVTGLGEALSRPMNTYSSGMQARLTFAISTALNPEILLVDEALGTGDASFNEIANTRMSELLERSGTVFVVSHSASALRRMCERAIWLHEGEIIAEGSLADLSPIYALWGEAVTQKEFNRAQEIVNSCKESYVPPTIEICEEIGSPLTESSYVPPYKSK